MCASQDEWCNGDAEHFILNKARNQDIVYFFAGQQMNYGTRRRSARFFMDNFEIVRPYTFLTGNVVEMAWYSSRSDTKETILSNPLFRCVNPPMDVLASCSMYRQAALGNLSTEGDIERINKFFEVCLPHL